MYNEKKCPKCGGNNPSNNNTCNHCGYSFSGRGGGVFTSKTNHSFTTHTSNGGVHGYRTTNYGNQSNKSNNGIGKIILFIIIVVFALNFIVPIFIVIVTLFDDYSNRDEYQDFEDEIIVYTCDELCNGNHVQKNGKCVCDDGNIYYDNTGEVYHNATGTSKDNYERCNVFCASGVKDYDSFDCKCMDGTNIDKYGNYFYDLGNDTDDIIENWEISHSIYNSPVITVFCDSTFYDRCDQYRGIVNAVRINNNLNIYYFDLGTISVSNRHSLLFGKVATGYNYNVPYTFVMKNYNIVKSINGHMEVEAFESFLKSAGVL